MGIWGYGDMGIWGHEVAEWGQVREGAGQQVLKWQIEIQGVKRESKVFKYAIPSNLKGFSSVLSYSTTSSISKRVKSNFCGFEQMEHC